MAKDQIRTKKYIGYLRQLEVCVGGSKISMYWKLHTLSVNSNENSHHVLEDQQNLQTQKDRGHPRPGKIK